MSRQRFGVPNHCPLATVVDPVSAPDLCLTLGIPASRSIHASDPGSNLRRVLRIARRVRFVKASAPRRSVRRPPPDGDDHLTPERLQGPWRTPGTTEGGHPFGWPPCGCSAPRGGAGNYLTSTDAPA